MINIQFLIPISFVYTFIIYVSAVYERESNLYVTDTSNSEKIARYVQLSAIYRLFYNDLSLQLLFLFFNLIQDETFRGCSTMMEGAQVPCHPPYLKSVNLLHISHKDQTWHSYQTGNDQFGSVKIPQDKKPYFPCPIISWKAQKHQVNITFQSTFWLKKRTYFSFPKSLKQELFQ